MQKNLIGFGFFFSLSIFFEIRDFSYYLTTNGKSPMYLARFIARASWR
ncbi:MAG: hypothetical protein UY03_C0019G0002 [Parcubacteria group bacterium GW2011_GWA2_47_64]|nr:MAG: hypothetical protein UY03_C0019G0002 [Parcubacteria group bacterium GW2011_GWA2_47_64]KKU95634.1 MAG: hypothetical protein UY29_C0022G0002 [Parcubacteria group bacterium GW2011_GWC2_48_17]